MTLCDYRHEVEQPCRGKRHCTPNTAWTKPPSKFYNVNYMPNWWCCRSWYVFNAKSSAPERCNCNFKSVPTIRCHRLRSSVFRVKLFSDDATSLMMSQRWFKQWFGVVGQTVSRNNVDSNHCGQYGVTRPQWFKMKFVYWPVWAFIHWLFCQQT